MITKSTVLILGAGASMDFGYPSGEGLIERLGQLPVGPIAEATGHREKEIDAFRTELRKSAHYSIDAFLSHRTEYIDIGKAMIAYILTGCEAETNLYPNGSWYRYLLHRMNTSFDRFHENQLTIVTFNYDRSLEHFLMTALRAGHNRSASEVADKLRYIPIIHVHGQLAPLEWQENKSGAAVRVYSNVRSAEGIRAAAAGIKVICENIDGSAEFEQAHKAIRLARQVYFLGFGYHADNMRRLNTPFVDSEFYDGDRLIAGTCYGMTAEERLHLIRNRHKGLQLGATGDKILGFLKNHAIFLENE